MTTLVQFRNFQGLEHIRAYIENAVDLSVGKFESWRHFNTRVIVGLAKGRSDLHHPIFECELVIRGTSRSIPLVVKKADPDIYRALRSCMHAAEKILRRSSKMRKSGRHHRDAEADHNLKPDSEFEMVD
jgi:ribosome-associated translation inhibitor RaiA